MQPKTRRRRGLYPEPAAEGKNTGNLVVNKIDKLADKQKLFQIMEGYNKLYKFAAIVPVSALNDSEFPGLVQEITKHLPEGPAYFPEDMITDQPERVIAAE